MTTLEEAFEEFKKLPDWDRFPMPEVFYEHFKLKKPQPSKSLMESLCYVAPPSVSLNKNGQVEKRGPAEGGVRPVEFLPTPPVEVKVLTDQTDDDKQPDSDQTTLNHPTEDSSSEILPGLDHQSLNPFYAAPDSVHDVPCHDAEYSPASQQPQSESS